MEDVKIQKYNSSDASQIEHSHIVEGNAQSEQDWNRRHEEREAEREHIRQRVRSATAKNEYFRPAKPQPTIQDDTKKTVAVYARVSTKSTEQTSSIENQTLYYTKKIAENPNWELQEIYSDEGKSGVSLRHRDAFNLMMENARAEKMDLILCASVSRFARNMSDCLEQISQLKTMHPSRPIGVFFETENIYTLDPSSEQSLHIHAMLADWESANKSRRMILSYDQRILTGQYPVSDLLGFRHTRDGDLIIQPEEAKTVRYMFLAYICGESYESIAQTLTEKRRPTLKGRVEWNGQMVRSIMSNERTWGDLEARKTIVVDYKKGVIVRNNGQRDSAYVPGHHKGIVSPQIARAAKLRAASSRNWVGGIPELGVITQGSLKGFIIAHPGWGGVSAQTFLSLCRSVCFGEDNSDENNDLAYKNAAISTETIGGYQVAPGVFFLTQRMPAMTISKKGFKFNKACHEKLGNCHYIDMLYHPIYQVIIIKGSDTPSQNSVAWINNRGNIVPIISARAYASAIYEIQRWIPSYQFRFRGIKKVRGNTTFLMFSLDEPRILVGKRSDFTNKEDSQFIPYKVESENTEQNISSYSGYPEEWSNRRAEESYAFCLAREKAIQHITEDDILNPGRYVENPMIGAIPSQEELHAELSQLLATM